mmetsp:Transcript_11074/g.20549  ORF Transcript_11074/g.20549 Transcript_11074/m.20549 type:complete len:209 (-) Transcript_11074:827-1453(-)
MQTFTCKWFLQTLAVKIVCGHISQRVLSIISREPPCPGAEALTPASLLLLKTTHQYLSHTCPVLARSAVPLYACDNVLRAQLTASRVRVGSGEHRCNTMAARATRRSAKELANGLKEASFVDGESGVKAGKKRSRNAYRTSTAHKRSSPTKFQSQVYSLISTIPEGKVSTYGKVAKKLSSSARAVGNALRNNPFAPRVPCHRVIASSR